jgi:hypothetical protein
MPSVGRELFRGVAAGVLVFGGIWAIDGVRAVVASCTCWCPKSLAVIFSP